MKYKGFIAYVFFGVCTTLVNLGCYRLLYVVLSVPNVPATVIAWLVAVLFAFVTNKLWVFKSPSFSTDVLFPELAKFFACRLATGTVDVLIMWISVDKLEWNAMLWKLISNGIVIVLNYIASRLIVFVRKEKSE